MTRMRASVLAGVLLAWFWGGATRPAAGQALTSLSPEPSAGTARDHALPDPGADKRDDRPWFRVKWDERPTFLFGDALRVGIIAKFHLDARAFDPEFDDQPDGVELVRKRLGVTGELFRIVEFEFETELRRENPVRDAFVNIGWNRYAAVKAGKYKMPFSLDALTSEARLDFIYRSRIGDDFAPGRDWGGSVAGALADRVLAWEAGVFQGDGENARFGDNPGAGTTFAARVTGRPLRSRGSGGAFGRLELGASFATGTIDKGLNGLRLRMSNDADIFSPVYVNGTRRRLGMDLVWRMGPASFRAEGLATADQRKEQGLSDEDLSDVVGRGWYVSGTWLLTGEDKGEHVRPRNDVITEGIGAVELAARYEFARMGSREHPGEPFRNPRAENILGNSDRAWTLGVNWYWNPYSKLQVNAIREDIEDTVRSPVTGRDVFWSYVARLQFAM